MRKEENIVVMIMNPIVKIDSIMTLKGSCLND